ncbi:MAG TPA: TetR/AcrR family transcriptional regulator [Solirubrobacterales bacterium]|nr:TetR/AcrR family transcriptional regulator [Solirubrobacterales bacterium]
MEGSLSRLSQVKPGGHALRREVVVHHQRERILAATVALVAAKGYRSVSVAAIVAEAGVSRLKFYENFGSKQDAFLAAFDSGLEEAATRVAAAVAEAGEDPVARVPAGIGALLDLLAARPDPARALIVEARSLGPEMAGRRDFTIAVLAPLVEGVRDVEGVAELPVGTEEVVLGGLDSILYDALLGGEPDPLTRLRPALVEFALLPFVGAARARAAAAA